MNTRKLKLLLAACVCCVTVAGCYYDNVEELYPDGCRTNDVRYADHVVPILEANNCLSCHNDGDEQGGINLEGYENVLERVEDGSLMGSVRQQQDWEAMPLTGNKMSNCSIDRLQSWIDAGALNN
jgi:hypothetical protein